MTTNSYPQWIYDLLENPEENDSEWGRLCHFCGSSHGHYDAPLEHYIDCPWVIACGHAGVWPEGHAIYEPTPSAPCETCGWHYDSPEDWRGREMPEPASDETRVAHDTHIANEHGITYEEYLAGPPTAGWPSFWHDGPMQWHDRWMREEIGKQMTSYIAERGGILFPSAPDLSRIRDDDA